MPRKRALAQNDSLLPSAAAMTPHFASFDWFAAVFLRLLAVGVVLVLPVMVVTVMVLCVRCGVLVVLVVVKIGPWKFLNPEGCCRRP